jgi:hypothetical protein
MAAILLLPFISAFLRQGLGGCGRRRTPILALKSMAKRPVRSYQEKARAGGALRRLSFCHGQDINPIKPSQKRDNPQAHSVGQSALNASLQRVGERP